MLLHSRYTESDDERNLASRALGVAVMGVFHLIGFLAQLIGDWPGPYNPFEPTTNGVCACIFMVLLGSLLRFRRHSAMAAGVGSALLIATFDLPNHAAGACGDIAGANLALYAARRAWCAPPGLRSLEWGSCSAGTAVCRS